MKSNEGFYIWSGMAVLVLLFWSGLALLVLFMPATIFAAEESACISCHRDVTPNIVKDFLSGEMGKAGTDCSDCHGSGHTSAADVANVQLPTEKTCQKCHREQHDQYMTGKHAAGWIAMSAMPKTGFQPHAYIQGMKGCGGCHKIGVRDEASRQEARYGSPCDSCHTRHKFSKEEASRPEACRTCHMGFDHPQWEMYSGSKHGVRYLLKQNGVIPDNASAPTCQTCHMQKGNHEVRTAWGFLAVRLPLPEDEQWKADRVTILQALGVLDPEGKPTKRLDVVKAADVARLDQESWQAERDNMVKTCGNCHSENFAKLELEKGDSIIKQADHLMAEGIRVVAGLYKDGVLQKPEGYAYSFPDLLTFHDAASVVEQKLFVMYLEHRMRTFQGTFHANPDYALWYGWSEMVRDLTEIKELAKQMRFEHNK